MASAGEESQTRQEEHWRGKSTKHEEVRGRGRSVPGKKSPSKGCGGANSVRGSALILLGFFFFKILLLLREREGRGGKIKKHQLAAFCTLPNQSMCPGQASNL